MPIKADSNVNAAYDKDYASSVCHTQPSRARDPVPMRRAAEKAALSIFATVIGTDDDVDDLPSTPRGDLDGDVYCLPSGPGSKYNPIIVRDDDSDDCADSDDDGIEISMNVTSSAKPALPLEGHNQIAEVEYHDFGDGSYYVTNGDETITYPPPDDSDSESDTGASAMEVESTSSENANLADNLAAIDEAIDNHFTVSEQINAFADKARGGRTNPGKSLKHLNLHVLRTNILEGGTDIERTDIPFLGNQSSSQHRNKRPPSPTRGGPAAGKGCQRRSTRRGKGKNPRYSDYELK